MTLYRQLIAIVSMLFLAAFIGMVSLGTANLRDFLDDQLGSHAQDTATSLGMSLSPAIRNGDRAVMETMIDAIFDRGYYRSIEVVSVDGETLIERSNPVTIPDVPAWFVRHVPLETPDAEALVMADWKQAATVRVRSHPGHAYRELWNNTVDTFRLFLLAALAVTMSGLLAIRILLRPLRGVEQQAQAICNGSYPIQEKLPRTRELRRVVEAMNRLSRKVNESFAKHSAITDRLRSEAYQDPLTGLYNRRWFDRQLQQRLDSRDAAPGGALTLVALHQLDRVNAESGYPAGDRLLQKTADVIAARLEHYPDSYLSRMSGAEFGIISANLDVGKAEKLASELASDLYRAGRGETGMGDCRVNIGVALWQRGDDPDKVLAEADIAMRTAQATGGTTWHRYKPQAGEVKPVRGAREWRDFLLGVIRSGDFSLCIQPVLGLDDNGTRVLHHELLARTKDASGEHLDAGQFMPMADHLGLSGEIDRIVVGLAIRHLQSRTRDDSPLAVNLSAGAVHDPAFIGWLVESLAEYPDTANRLMFEMPEHVVMANPDVTAEAIRVLSAAGYACGIDHFGRDFRSLARLRSLGVRYLRIDGSYTRDIHRENDNQFLLRALCTTAHSIDVQVFAGSIENADEADMIARLDVDGVQGYHYGPPQPV